MDFFFSQTDTFLTNGDLTFWVLVVKLAESFKHKLISSYAEKSEKCLSFCASLYDILSETCLPIMAHCLSSTGVVFNNFLEMSLGLITAPNYSLEGDYKG